jgi:hypothetical protein
LVGIWQGQGRNENLLFTWLRKLALLYFIIYLFGINPTITIYHSSIKDEAASRLEWVTKAI